MTKDETLRLALEALVMLLDNYVPEATEEDISQVETTITAIKSALEAKDEPDKYAMDIECTKCGAKQSGVLTVHTNPPQRTWVGLTDEEVADIERNSITRRQAIRAIEAKLKEKNT